MIALSPQRLVLLQEALDAYGDIYAKRSRSRNGRIFERDEPDSLAALWLSVVVRNAERPPRQDVAQALTALTRDFLTETKEHTLCTDITGLAWADAYGVVPLERPPVEQLEFVFLSGMPRGSIRGLLGSAWRSLFLATALPTLNWQHRPAAVGELDRRLDYLRPRVEALAAEGGDPSVTPRVGFVVGELAKRTADADLAVRTSELVRGVAPPDDSWAALSTAHLGQLASAAGSSGLRHLHTRIVEHLLDERVVDGTRLLAAASNGTRAELSPWVPLALALLNPREGLVGPPAHGTSKRRMSLRRR